MKECLNSFRVLPVDREALELAAAMPASDFEDNRLAACAQLARLDAIVTRDPRGYAGSPVPALSPAEFLARLQQEGQVGPDADSGAVDGSRWAVEWGTKERPGNSPHPRILAAATARSDGEVPVHFGCVPGGSPMTFI